MAQLKKKNFDFASKGPFVFAKWNNIIDVKMSWKIIVFEYFIMKLFGIFYFSVLLGIVKFRGRLYYFSILFIQREPSQQGMWLILGWLYLPNEDQGGKACDFLSQQIPNFQFYFISHSYSIPVQFNLLFYNQTQI